MKNATLNTNHESYEISKWFVIGILFILNLNNISFLIRNLIREMFMFFSVSPVVNFWITELITMFVMIATSLIFFNFLRRIDREKTAKTINYLLVLFFLIIILKYLFQNYFISFLSDDVLSKMKIYNREIISVKMYSLFFLLFEFFTYAIITLFLIRKRKNDKDLQNSL